jgi:hypothetical protein
MMHIMILFYLFYYITSHLSTIFEDQLGFVVAIKLNDNFFFVFCFFTFIFCSSRCSLEQISSLKKQKIKPN